MDHGDACRMKALHFLSDVLESGRYSSQFRLPDYPYTADGKFDRETALQTLFYEEYGVVNDADVRVSTRIVRTLDAQFAGKCRHITVECNVTNGNKCASFPVDLFLLPEHRQVPLILQISFARELPNKYAPIEEILDHGVSLAYVCYQDITTDSEDFETGIAPLLTDRTQPHAAGKLALWSWALRRIADFLLENGYTDPDHLYLAGHSRLGKTALLTAAADTRFAGVCVNNSGCCGAAISREKTGETITKICEVFPYWFAPHFLQYVGREDELPFDQHWLCAAVAPRKLCINTALLDTWADTDAQYLAAEAASVIYRQMGVEGLDQSCGYLPNDSGNSTGQIAFFKRSGTHFFSRADWNFFLEFILHENAQKMR